MSCKPTYKGKRYNSLEELYRSAPQLSAQQKLEAQQLYSQYLDTIFPDSKVKGVNYHGTEYQQKFEKFDSKLAGTQTREGLQTKGFWFTYQKDVAEDFGSNVISVLLNVKNPYRAEAKLSELNVITFPDQVESVNKAINQGYDSAFVDVLENLESGQGTTELVVFEPEQIHILGSKQDIEGFKEFVNKPKIKTFNVKDITPTTTLSDIAKLLNTSDIEFKDLGKVDNKIRFSLTPNLKKTVNYALAQTSSQTQREIIKRLFHQVSTAKEEIESLSASATGPLVILNTKDHTYYDILNNGEVYKSTTERIKGKLSEDDLFNKKLNIDLGNDFDRLLQGITSDMSFEEIAKDMKVLNTEQTQRAYESLQRDISYITVGGGVAIPQVVVYDETTKTAGTIDILIVMPDGSLRVVDLKTSKNSVKDSEKYDREYNLGDDSDLKKAGIKKLSTRAQQGLQVNMYRRMLENMGYKVDEGDLAASTLHIQVGIEGVDQNQKFTGEFKFDSWETHPVSQNRPYVDILLSDNVDLAAKQDLENKTKNDDGSYINFQDELTDEEKKPENNLTSRMYKEYAVIGQALETYKGALYEKNKALDTIKSSIYMDRSKEKTKEMILHSISDITIALTEGGAIQSKIYTDLLRDALRQIEKFAQYMKDPKNFDKQEYITYALNFERFIKTFEGLYLVKDVEGLNDTQKLLILRLQTKLNELGQSTNDKEGLINQAIVNYVKEQVKLWSSRDDLTEDVLNDIMTAVRDIPDWELYVNDMDTSSDTLLAVVSKIYKSNLMKMYDLSDSDNRALVAAASKLQKLSLEKDPQKLYLYMLEKDENGKPTGRLVKKLGRNYNDTLDRLRSELFDDNGNKYDYRDVSDVKTAKPEDIEFNIKLAKANNAYSKFWKAERVGLNNEIIPGEYHRYTDAFIKEREKYQYPVIINENIFWKKKSNISDRDYQVFLSKYYNKISYTQAKKNRNGQYTGVIVRDAEFDAVKPEFRIANDANTITGERMTSDQYNKIMNPTDALGEAQKEYYLLYTRIYEEKLKKFEPGVRDQMIGRIPLVMGTMFNNLKDKPNYFAKMWAKGVREFKELFTTTEEQRAIVTDESGNVVDQLPVYYIGRPRDDKKLEEIQNKIDDLKERYKKGQVKALTYDKELGILNAQYMNLQNKPSTEELNLDLTASLVKFNMMAEYYSVMSEVEDTFNAFVKVVEQREYQPSTAGVTVGKWVKDKFVPKALKSGVEKKAVTRLKKWMAMIYYQNDTITRGFFDKASDALIQYSSLSYVAFNPFGNINNYLIARVNNGIEAIGQRFYSRSAYLRAEIEFNKRAIPDTIKRLSSSATSSKSILGDIQVKMGIADRNDYDPKLPGSKYEALVDLFGMMISKMELREELFGPPPINKSYFRRLMDFGYVLQDAAEYNVQTKAGMAILIDTMIMNKKTGDIMSLYDAFEFDSETKSVRLKEGYDTIVTLDKNNVDENGNLKVLKEQSYNDAFRYQLRNKILEVNKQIHGNYAKTDRMVIQAHAVGRLAAQFHKWVVPAIKARFRREYFDENLGWMEGRYISFWRFLKYSFEEISKANLDIKNYGKGFIEKYKEDEKGYVSEQRAEDKLLNTYRTLGEIGIILTTFMLNAVLRSLFEDDEDDQFAKKSKNYLRYQADRINKELILFTPLGAKQVWQMLDTPIASTKTLGEISEALLLTVFTPIGYLTKSEEDFYADKYYVYQRGTRAGQLKLKKEWMDAVPILYSFKKWQNFDNLTNFYIK